MLLKTEGILKKDKIKDPNSPLAHRLVRHSQELPVSISSLYLDNLFTDVFKFHQDLISIFLETERI